MVKHAVDYGGGAGPHEVFVWDYGFSNAKCPKSLAVTTRLLQNKFCPTPVKLKDIPQFGLTLLKQVETMKALSLAFKVESAGVKGRFKPRSGRGKRPFALAEKGTTFFAFYAFLCLIFTPLT